MLTPNTPNTVRAAIYNALLVPSTPTLSTLVYDSVR